MTNDPTHLTDKYRRDLERGVAKETAARNALFAIDAIRHLGAELLQDEELHGKTIESTALTCLEMISWPDPEREGWQRATADLSKPHVVVKIQIELVGENSHSELIRQPDLEYEGLECD